MPPDRNGQVIGKRFRIDALIGKGAMADVFRAVDLTTSAYVALKILRAEIGDPAGKQRFAREGEVQARLRHRNVAAMLATGVTDHSEPFLVLELLRGNTLRGLIKKTGRVEPYGRRHPHGRRVVQCGCGRQDYACALQGGRTRHDRTARWRSQHDV